MKNNEKKGFTLIELMIVIAVIGILSAITIVSTSNQRNKKDVESAAQLTSTIIREAQTSALTGQQFIPGTVPCLYLVTWSGSSVSVTYTSKDASDTCNQSVNVSNDNLPGGVTFLNGGNVQFTLPHGELNPNTPVTIDLQKNGASKSVCIQISGLVVDC